LDNIDWCLKIIDALVNMWKLLWHDHLRILEIEGMLLCRLLDWGVTNLLSLIVLIHQINACLLYLMKGYQQNMCIMEFQSKWFLGHSIKYCNANNPTTKNSYLTHAKESNFQNSSIFEFQIALEQSLSKDTTKRATSPTSSTSTGLICCTGKQMLKQCPISFDWKVRKTSI
jgi:hypothetical protein